MTQNVKSFQYKFKGTNFSDDIIYRQMTTLNDNQVLIYTNLGILLFDINTKSIIDYYNTDEYESKTFAPSFKDNYQRFWISTVQGLNIYSLAQNRFQIVKLNKNFIGQNLRLKSILEDSTNQVLYFLKELGNKVYRYDLGTNRLTESFDKFNENSDFQQSSIVTIDILFNQQKELLLLTRDKIYKRVGTYWKKTDLITRLKTLPYSDMELLRDGRMIVSSIYEGVQIYNFKNQDLSTIHPESLVGDGGWAYNIFEDRNNGFILSQLGRGITHFDKNNDIRYQNSFFENVNKQGHFSTKDLHFLEDQKYLVCGGSDGVLRLDENSKIEKLNLMENFSIYAFESDIQKNIWMLSSSGLIKSNAELDSIIFFNYPDPSFNITTNLGQNHNLVSLSDGRMLFTGSESLCFFDPLTLARDKEPSIPIIDKIISSDSIYIRNQILENPKLSYRENSLILSFHNINYTKNHKPKFKYMLQGVDENWNYSNSINEVRYTNLAPGSYTFKLNSSNRDEVWHPTLDQISFVILAPWWKTAWAYLFYFLGLSLILYTWYRYQKQKWKLQSDLRLEQEKNARSELQKKASIMNALLEGAEGERIKLSRELHDGVGAVLASAGMFIESLGHKYSELNNDTTFHRSKDLVKESCDEIRSLSHQLMPISLKNLGFKLAIENLLLDLNKAAKLSTICELNIKDGDLNEQLELHIYRIMQEIFKNIFQHANARRIDLKMEILNDQLLIRLQNDGIKFNLEQGLEKNGLGLKNIMHRVDLLNGSITVSSDEDYINRYLIKIPLPINIKKTQIGND